jgi:hypothetical protein
MNFSDLPNNSWEKVMVKLVDFIGGDGPSLVKWSGEIPNPKQTAKQILGVLAYYEGMDYEQTERFIQNFLDYCEK